MMNGAQLFAAVLVSMTPAHAMVLQSPAAAGPSFLGAVFGIGLDGSPWQYMLRLRRSGYKDVARVPLGPAGDFYFLMSEQTVKQVCVDDAATFPLRFSVPLFNTLQLDKGIVYEQGARHKRQKRLCIPSFESSISMASFLEAVQEEALATSADWTARLEAAGGRELRVDLYREMRRTTLSVVLRVTFGLGGAAREYDKAEELSEVLASRDSNPSSAQGRRSAQRLTKTPTLAGHRRLLGGHRRDGQRDPAAVADLTTALVQLCRSH